MNLGVTGGTKRLKVFPVVCSTFAKGFAVVYLFNRNIDALLQALLTPGMCFGISLADPVPSAVIFLLGFTIAMVFLIVLVGFPLVVRTIPFMCQPWTTGMVAGVCWLSRH